MGTIINVEGLSKKYTISHQAERYLALRDVIANSIKGAGGYLLHPFSIFNSKTNRLNPKKEDFWALSKVSFEVKQGDRIGIIGRNGAGKSTLLKILSRITEPTTGSVKIKGRVASLLEVGTGFHPELTGRENIYLNGAILGMKRAEIKRKYDEIVAFAEVERFLDTPVKRYSSGMYVRLAFAVAAHLEPEILLVDEVLAVGDAQFQKKCLGKMEDVSLREGRTILFVSHNMSAVMNMCNRAIMIDQGQIKYSGNANDTIQKYIDFTYDDSAVNLGANKNRKGNGKIRFTSVAYLDKNGQKTPTLISGEKNKLLFVYENNCQKDLKSLCLAIAIQNAYGEKIGVYYNETIGEVFANVPKDNRVIELDIGKLSLMPGRYTFTLFCKVNEEIADWVQNATFFDVVAGDFYGTGRLPPEGRGNILFDDYHFSFGQKI